MQSNRHTIADLMFVVVFVAILLTVFRTLSFVSVVILTPFAITAFIAPLGSSSSGRRRLLWVGASGTLLLPVLLALLLSSLFAILLSGDSEFRKVGWRSFLPALSVVVPILSFVGLIPTLIVQAHIIGRDH